MERSLLTSSLVIDPWKGGLYMFNSWDLHVTNFGRIEEATITVSPFMMFVGKNNSGKSYMMQLLWGIVHETYLLTATNSFKAHSKMIELARKFKYLLDKKGEIEINKDVQDDLLNAYNEILDKNKNSLLKQIFNHEVTINKLKISRNNHTPFILKNDREVAPDLAGFNGITSNSTKIFLDDEWLTSLFMPFSEEHLEFNAFEVLRTILVLMVTKDFKEPNEHNFSIKNTPIYFPASRSGFMQTYRAIVGNVFEARMNKSVYEEDKSSAIAGTQLTLPVTQFISQLQKHNFSSDQREKYAEEIAFLHSQLLGGEIDKDESQQFRFRSAGDQQAYPLHVTSSLISELAPISIFLSAQSDPDLWIIEEVESHLHSEMQLRMARFLFRMLNKRKSIWITTHSDNLAQQINNLLTISQHPHKHALLEQLRYEEADILQDLSMVNAYQFEAEGDSTIVTRLPLESYGFVIDTFNDTLKKLIQETDLIQNYAE